MKKYSQLTIIQAINFKSWCVAKRYALFGDVYDKRFVGNWNPITVDGILMDIPLHEYQYNRPYRMTDLKKINH